MHGVDAHWSDITAKVAEVRRSPSWAWECVLDGELVIGAGLPSDFYSLAGLLVGAPPNTGG